MTTIEEQLTSNDLVMEEIIKSLDVAGLKNFRLVCTDWYMRSVEVWKKIAFVRLRAPETYSTDDRGYIICNYECPAQDLVRFLEETCDHNFRNILGELPFQNFSLTSWDMYLLDQRGEQRRVREKVTENMWKAIRQLAFHLQLNIDSCYHSLNPVICDLGPNMTRLELNCKTDSASFFYKLSSLFLEGPVNAQVKRLEFSTSHSFLRFNFLIKFPNLEELKISSLSNSNEGNADAEFVITTLRTIRFSKKRRNIYNLKHFDLIEATNARDLVNFVEVDLPLTYLTLGIGGGSQSHFQRCMEHYAKSLKILKLRGPAQVFKPLGFPAHIKFSNLQVLELWGFVVNNLNFLKEAPHLRKLRLDLLCNELTRDGNMNRKLEHSKIDSVRNIVENSGEILGNEDFQCLKVQELLLDFQLSEKSWKTLRRWMPNLRVLETPLDNTSFRQVCAQWPKLRKLGCRLGSEIDDDGIVGDRESQKDSGRQQTILDLEYLESIELEAPCGQGKITDRSAEFGFLKMNYLRNLKASVAPNLVTEDMEMQLKERIGHLEIFRKCRNENIPLKPRENVCCHWAAAVSNRLQS